MFREEADMRMVDSSLRSSEYQPINIFINFYLEPEYKFKVPRTNFFPQPKVLGIDLSWRMHKSSDGQRRRVQICMGLLKPFKVYPQILSLSKSSYLRTVEQEVLSRRFYRKISDHTTLCVFVAN
ncbi:ribosomal RNA small subunit methyltransferase, chloroplastic isoform X3 [Capsicum annuum]|uniref:ribosomal RNA small subunit methyltransferase, chloroplastic isoform X3 n=1 Tax=Capsicum annuum TaxID=4072 RepID=UPI0007BEAC7A|nr:ribosomal RNA small subunit methyltransferase, chloroplastic isoform X3 [Capsicum annuum]